MQNRKHYANGKTVESATGYTVRVGEPLVDMTAKAASTSLSMPSDPIQDGSYLISLEVNGTVVAAREAYDFASGSCTVGDYTLAYSSGAVTVSTTSNNDVVVLKIEPLEVFTTDEFRAAVKNACKCDSSSGGGSGGGVLLVHETASKSEGNTLYTLDRTYAEIASADAVLIVRKHEIAGVVNVSSSFIDAYGFADGFGYAVHFYEDSEDRIYLCSSTSDYPVYTQEK